MGAIKTLLLPETFQGAKKKPPYFEGWYFKLQAPDGRIFALIPGISLSGCDCHSFIQVIADGRSHYFRYPLEAFSFSRDRLEIRVGESVFTAGRLHIVTDILSGEVDFTAIVPFARHRYGLGIMGPFALVPHLECRHGVVTVRSVLKGSLTTGQGGGRISLDGGFGYVEKDWGSAFPDAYVWVQAFLEGAGSIMVSAAGVPAFGRTIRGLAAFLYDGVGLHTFTTYGGAAVKDIIEKDGGLALTIQSPRHRLTLTLRGGGTVGLKAPESTGMGREVRESIEGSLQVTLERGGGSVFSGSAQAASIECSGDIGRLR